MSMGRRRVNWLRVWLKCGFLVCLVSYVAIAIATFFMDNGGRVKAMLAEEMKDMTAPVIELEGGDSMTIAVGDTLAEPGIKVYDNMAIPRVEVESLVDVEKAGEYKIHYWATDGLGNIAERTRKVKVVQPTGRVYLTFDDGPSEYTGALLDTLKRYNVKATFFVTGYGDDALIRREYDEGHAVGVHSLTHNYAYIYANKGNYYADFEAVRERVKNLTGEETHLMRFPGGSSNIVSRSYDGGHHIMSDLTREVEERGMTYFDWNVDSDDAGHADTADAVYNNVVSALKVGGDSVVLQHDAKPYSVEAVERIIQYGLEHDYVFNKLSTSSCSSHHGVNN